MNATAPLSVRRCVRRARRAIGGFRRDRAGNVAIIFALSLVPVFGAVGAAVDYSRANSARTAMQVALDTTALMISKEALDLNNAQVQKKAKTYFDAQFSRPDVKKLNVTFDMQTNGPGDFTVIAQATGTIDTAIARVIGKDTIDLRTTSQVRWGFKALEIALALDNTGSMAAKNKMTELKAAVKLLIAQMKKNSKVPDDTKIAIIPFSTVVNVGTGFVDAPWLAYDSTITKANWQGCVADRDQPNDVKDTAPTGGAATMFPVANCGSLAKALPLTSDWAAMDAVVDAMTPSGMTNVTIGTMWGWHALTQGEPFTQAKAVKNDVEKVLILLTDGLNTQDRWYTDQASIDARQALTCNNINAAGFTLYAIQVNTGGDPTSTLLQNCAGSPGKYPDSSKFFLLTSANQIVTTFNAIGTNLSQLRISK